MVQMKAEKIGVLPCLFVSGLTTDFGKGAYKGIIIKITFL